jgi:MFS family permease
MSTLSANPPAATARFPTWQIVAAGSLILLLAFGPRSTFGFYLRPITDAHGWTREHFALALAVQNLAWGVGGVGFGALADRFGTAMVLIVGAVLYAGGLAMTAWAPTPLWLTIGAGVLVGLGVGACSFGIVMAAIGRAVSAEKRSLVFGIATAAGSLGQFVFAPLSQGLIQAFGWQSSLLVMAGLLVLVPFLTIPLAGKPSKAMAPGEMPQSFRAALAEAFGHGSYLLLAAGFFVCGFQVAFVTVHFPAYLLDIGIEARWGVIAIMLVGLFNIVGTLGVGALGLRFQKRILLSAIYFGRAVIFTLFILLPVTPVTVVLFSMTLGTLWLSTVPATNTLVSIMFGTRYLATLGGIVFLSHQVGSFLGVWLGGLLYDLNHSYVPVWWMCVALALLAGLVNLPIREEPVARGLVPAE